MRSEPHQFMRVSIGDEAEDGAPARVWPLHVGDHSDGCDSVGAHGVDDGVGLLGRKHSRMHQLGIAAVRPSLLIAALLVRLHKGELGAGQQSNIRRRHVVPRVRIDALDQLLLELIGTARPCAAAAQTQLAPGARDFAPAAHGEGAVGEIRLPPQGGIGHQARVRLAPAVNESVARGRIQAASGDSSCSLSSSATVASIFRRCFSSSALSPV